MKQKIIAGLALLLTVTACSKKEEAAGINKGIGPVKSVTLAPLDSSKASQGQQLFQAKCSACHKIDEKYIGPALKGVTKRRAPEWVMNMILNPAEMTQKDPVAKDLLATHFTQMTFQNMTEDEARSILEFFRQNDAQ